MGLKISPPEVLFDDIPSNITFDLTRDYQYELTVISTDSTHTIQIETLVFLRLAPMTPYLYSFKTFNQFSLDNIDEDKFAVLLHQLINYSICNFNKCLRSSNITSETKEELFFRYLEKSETQQPIQHILGDAH